MGYGWSSMLEVLPHHHETHVIGAQRCLEHHLLLGAAGCCAMRRESAFDRPLAE